MSATVVQMSPAPPPKKDKPRTRRAQTAAPTSSSSTSTPTNPSSHSNSTTPTTPTVPPKQRRSHSQDQQQSMSSSSRGNKKEKKASMHADVIDMLDYSGNARFHHDGPFDAVAPSRNRHPNRAPMGVFDLDALSPSTGGGPYPTAAIAAVASVPPRPLHSRVRSATAGPGAGMPSVAINPAFISPALQPDKKRNAVAEAWGIADPEPFEEFSAGGAAINNGHTPTSASAPSGSLGRSAYNDYWNEGDAQRNATRNARRARAMPPPQQIMLPGSNYDPNSYRDRQEDTPGADEKFGSPVSPTAYPGTSPPRFKRTKSLMQRIRTMRENPNVPVGAPDPDEPDPVNPFDAYSSGSPSLEEPRPVLYASERDNGSLGVHPSTSNTSFEREGRSSAGRKGGMNLFGRLGRNPRHQEVSSSPPLSPAEENGFVVVHSPHGTKHKALPSLPPEARSPPVSGSSRYENDSYFDSHYAPESPATPGTPGLGRKRSLLSKMKGVSRR